MARKSAPVLLVDETSPKEIIEVLRSEAIYAVYYDQSPINIRRFHALLNVSRESPAKYVKSSFSNPAHAFNLAEKLNKRFKTDKFSVFKMDLGVEVQEDPDTE